MYRDRINFRLMIFIVDEITLSIKSQDEINQQKTKERYYHD